MAKLSLRHIYKVYPNGTKAVSDFNMEIADKEFIVFVGPSGCGKSTTLRMIAGLEDISAGELYIGDELVNDVEPKDRDIAMVFQNYALYPHMTVYENMAFGLKLRHVSAEEIHEKVLWAANILKLTEYLDTKPRAMSGGQRQRVALGRAILRNPKVFLLDEPLSNLDAKLRTEMRAEIAKLHQQLQTTFIYVTHDQIEAMTLGTRVVVMKLGRIQQVDTPQNLYEFPENKFVAGFIGTPQMNFFEAVMNRNKDIVEIKFDYCDNKMNVPFNDLLKVRPSYFDGNEHVWVGLRCEDISIDPEIVNNSKNKMKVKISHFEELGNETLVYGDLNMQGDGFIETSTRVIIKAYHGKANIKAGDVIDAAFDMSKAHFFDKETEMTIVPRIPIENVFDCNIKDNIVDFYGNKLVLPPAIRCPDTELASVFIPTDSIYVSNKDGIEVTVDKIEILNMTRLAYLKIENRTFFAIVDDKVKVGEKIKINIDFKCMTIKSKGNILVESLNKYDSYLGSFSNYENDKKAIDSIIKFAKNDVEKKRAEFKTKEDYELGMLGIGDYLYKQYKEEYKEDLEKNKQNLSFDLLKRNINKEEKRSIRSKFNEANEKSKKVYEDKITKLNEIAKSNIDNSAKCDEITQKYDSIFNSLDNELKIYSVDLLKSKVDKKTFFKKEKNDAELKLKEESKKLQVKFESNEDILNQKFSTDDVVRKTELAKLKVQYEKDLDDLYLTSKVFYANINGCYVESKKNINKKIIQALGLAIFTSNYRFEIPHDAYRIVEKDGFKAHVEDVLNYGIEKFAKCVSYGNIIYVKVLEDVKKGSDILLSFEIDKTQIYENKYDIRLY